MILSIYSANPELFTYLLATLIVKGNQTVNIHSDNVFGFLFDDNDTDKERDGIWYNKSDKAEYEIYINPTAYVGAEEQIVVTNPSYRNLLKIRDMNVQGNYYLVKEFLSQKIKSKDENYLDILGLDKSGLKGSYFINLDEYDLVTLWKIGSETTININKMSKGYQVILIQFYKILTGASVKNLKDIERLALKRVANSEDK